MPFEETHPETDYERAFRETEVSLRLPKPALLNFVSRYTAVHDLWSDEDQKISRAAQEEIRALEAEAGATYPYLYWALQQFYKNEGQLDIKSLMNELMPKAKRRRAAFLEKFQTIAEPTMSVPGPVQDEVVAMNGKRITDAAREALLAALTRPPRAHGQSETRITPPRRYPLGQGLGRQEGM